MEKLLTIVVPTYNMENYLNRCLDSVIVDDILDRVQVLIVNDGSTDSSSEIAHEYERKYPNSIQVIDKDNGNYGSCMNLGLSMAQGKYFRSLDPDDWFDTNNFKLFVKELENTNADMLLGERYEYHEDTKIIKHVVFSSDVTSFHQDLPMTKSNCNFDSYYELSMVWGLTYKTSILIASGLRWDEGVFYTDNEFDFWPLKLIKTIRFIPIPVYVYLLGREGQSVSVNNQERNFNSYVVVSNSMMDELLKVYNKESEVGEMQLFFCWRVFCHVFPKLLYFGGTHKEELVVFTSKLQNNRNVFDYFNKKMTCYGINYIDAYFNK